MKSFLLVLCFSIFISCSNTSDENLTCNVNNPLEEISWLQQIKTNFEQSASATKKQIIQYTYNEESVFLIDFCNGCADNLTTVYNCTGDVICEFGGIAGLNTCTDFNEIATNKIILWGN
jgi:hypothetical protein